jgi:predicted alpha/beta superfamily hydrolase
MTRLLLFVTFLLLPEINIAQPPGNLPKPFVLGEIRQLHSAVLSEDRTLNIYLPAGYTAADTQYHNVIYLLDGSAEEDFIHIAGLVQFNSFEWVARLPPTIVVGIATVDRRRDFTFGSSRESDTKLAPTSGGSAAFMQFLEKELQPFIDRTYRTTNNRMLIGQSLGGLFATEVLLKKPHLFSQYVIVSPSLWWDSGSLLKHSTALIAGRKPLPKVYLAVGKEGLGPSVPPRNMEADVRTFVKTLRPVLGTHLRFDYLPAEDHGTILHEAVSRAFRWGK